MPFAQPSLGLKLLTDTREVVASGWCQGTDARDDDGAAVEPWDDNATCWSLLGAIVSVLEHEARTQGEVPLDELAAALYALAAVLETDSLVDWNDAPGRMQDEVLTVLAAAEREYEPPWPETARPHPN
jgi:hypothetical protein